MSAASTKRKHEDELVDVDEDYEETKKPRAEEPPPAQNVPQNDLQESIEKIKDMMTDVVRRIALLEAASQRGTGPRRPVTAIVLFNFFKKSSVESNVELKARFVRLLEMVGLAELASDVVRANRDARRESASQIAFIVFKSSGSVTQMMANKALFTVEGARDEDTAAMLTQLKRLKPGHTPGCKGLKQARKSITLVRYQPPDSQDSPVAVLPV